MNNPTRILLLLFTTGLVSTSSMGQNTGISITGGMATFAMEDFKYLQEKMLDNYPVEANVVSAFPPYSLISVNLVRTPYPFLRWGGGYSFSTTGAKSDYTDYSGSLTTMYYTMSYRLGLFASGSIIKGELLDVSAFGRADANMTRLKISTTLRTYTYSENLTDVYRGFSPNLSGGLEVLFHVRNLDLGLEGGYLLDLQGSLTNTDSQRELHDPDDPTRLINSDWSGWRVGIKMIRWLRNPLTE